jgi:hypothetical protein
MIETIRSLMSSASELETIEEVKGRLATVMSDLDPLVEKASDDISDDRVKELLGLEGENTALRDEASELKQRLERSEAKLARAVEIGETLTEKLAEAEEREQEAVDEAEEARLDAYKAESVRSATNGSELKSLLEGIDERSAIDKVVEHHSRAAMTDGDLERMRSTLRKGSESSNLLMERADGGAILGHSMGDLRKLAGIQTANREETR